MNLWNLAQRSLRFYLRSHLGTVSGAAIATAVLTGALLVGDSVRGSLRAMALARLGKVDFALASGDRLFRDALAREMALSNALVVPALQLPGTAGTPDASARASQVTITGVLPEFWQLAQIPPPLALSNNAVFLNAPLARQLKARPGDTIILRAPKISHLSRDAPLSPEEDSTVALRLEVARILSDAEFGRFGLSASQLPPFNAFVPLPLLQNRVNATNQANLLLAAAPAESVESLDAAFRAAFKTPDAQLQFRPVSTNEPSPIDLRSPRVFLDYQISSAALQAAANAQPVFTYFVNRIELGGLATPYSMVTGSDFLIPPGMRDDEILLNQWTADDLQAKPGDTVSVRYYIMGLMRELVERTNQFRVRAIVPMQAPYADPSLMPDFPGMTDADNCRDWDTGFPIDTEAIRDKDELYWDQYRGAPKAFVTLGAARQMWSNRFGDLTSVRYAAAGTNAIAASILHKLQPRELGFFLLPVRQMALAASAGAQDFGGLFIGFSFFLIAASLLLMSLLFRFALEQRGVEIGTLLALGFLPKKVSRLLLLEGLGLAVLGGLIGVALATLYARAMLWGLSTVWSDAVAGTSLSYFGSPATLVTGFFTGVVVAVVTIAWSLRREARRPARELLAGELEQDSSKSPASRPRQISLWGGCAALALGLGLAGWGWMQGESARADLFFSAGALVLAAGLFLTTALIRRLEFSSAAAQLSLTGMGLRGVTRRRRRSRAAVALLACGAFLIASIGAFRLDSGKDAEARSSGTGGFTLLAESTIPVVHNLNAQAGREFFGLREAELEGVRFLPFRMLQGEDASCLNLNRAQRPRLLGVDPAQLRERKAFTFAKTVEGADPADPWELLDRDFGPDVVPAIGDAASIQWALGKKIGDTLPFFDAVGREFKIKLVGGVANSILQGNLIIAESRFVQRFPSEAGYRMFLIDAPSNRAESLAALLTKALQDTGLEVTRARDRLAAFNAVQNTYLGTFQMLGGLGLLLGSFGLGVILLRNVFERRGELALLVAVGFRKSALRWLILSEHAALLLLGLAVGVTAALVAVLPSLFRPGSELPYLQLGLTLGAVFACGLAWTLAAASRALKAPLLAALRSE